MTRLVVFNAGTVRRAQDGRLSIAHKTATGVQAYVQRWPGEVVFLTHEVAAETSEHDLAALGSSWRTQASLTAEYVGLENPMAWLRKLSHSDIVLALLKDSHAQVLETPAKVVWTGELSLETRIRQGLVANPSAAQKLRIIAGAVRQERLLRQLVRESEGLQANGYPAWHAYAGLSKNPLLFFDTRLGADQVETSEPRLPVDVPLRLAFSGRHTLGKGPQYAVQLAKSLRKHGVDCTLDVFGRGELTPQLRVFAGPETAFHGDVDFDREWVPFVREHVDLMVLPHRQGDPSGTYLEAAGLGVPALGFNNEALEALVVHAGIGWTVRDGDGRSLLEQALQIMAEPRQLEERSANGLEFMRKHSSDSEFDARIRHLKSVAAG